MCRFDRETAADHWCSTTNWLESYRGATDVRGHLILAFTRAWQFSDAGSPRKPVCERFSVYPSREHETLLNQLRTRKFLLQTIRVVAMPACLPPSLFAKSVERVSRARKPTALTFSRRNLISTHTEMSPLIFFSLILITPRVRIIVLDNKLCFVVRRGSTPFFHRPIMLTRRRILFKYYVSTRLLIRILIF